MPFGVVGSPALAEAAQDDLFSLQITGYPTQADEVAWLSCDPTDVEPSPISVIVPGSMGGSGLLRGP